MVKADGLASGKGVFICKTESELVNTIDQIMSAGVFGSSGDQIVVEAFISGEEVSMIAICDGSHIELLDSSQDHKAAYDNDQGPNTGGMGAYSPAPIVTDALRERILQTVFIPTLKGLESRGIRFQGFLYAGLMIDDDKIYVLEYNVRLGDPEAQALLMRMRSDLAPMLLAAASGRLEIHVKAHPLEFETGYSICVVAASAGYPGAYSKDIPIRALESFQPSERAMIFHAGTRRIEIKNQVTYHTSGGRVLNYTTKAPTLKEAQSAAYDLAKKYSFSGAQIRTDIGNKAFHWIKE